MKDHVRLQIDTKPPGAEVHLSPVAGSQDVPEELTPFVRWLKPGTWKITATLEHCEPTRTQTTLRGQASNLEITLDCPPRGGLLIATLESDARILLDGEEIGRTPTNDALQIVAGRHMLRLEKSGCQPWEQAVTMEAGQPLKLQVPLARVLQITAAQGGGVVKLDGELAGEIPDKPPHTLRLHALPGEHRVEVTTQGFEPFEQAFTIEPNQPLEPIDVSTRPVPTQGTLTLAIQPEINAGHLLVDGQKIADLPLRKPLALETGTYPIEVRADGCRVWSRPVETQGGASHTVYIALDCAPPERPIRPATISWLTMGSVSLIVGTMGGLLMQETEEERDIFLALGQSQRTSRRFIALEREHARYRHLTYLGLGAAAVELSIGITLLGLDQAWWIHEEPEDPPKTTPSWLSPGNLSLMAFSFASAATGVVAVLMAQEAHDEAADRSDDDLRRSTRRQAELEARTAQWRIVSGVAFASAVAAGSGALISILIEETSTTHPTSEPTALRLVPLGRSGGQLQLSLNW